MATPSDASNLANVSRCYSTCIPPDSLLGVAIYLLALRAGITNPMSSETASLLANQAKCFSDCIPPGDQLGVIIYLLSTGGGGGGGAGGITVQAGPPPIDGSVTTLFDKNSLTGEIFINSGTVANPTWDPI